MHSEAATLFQRIEVLPGRRVRHAAVASLLVLVLGVLSGCATIGSGRAEVVRAEDVLVNALPVYDSVMALHYQISAQEPPDVYEALEKARKTFPSAWRTARSTVRGYKAGRGGDITAALAALEDALDELRDLLGQIKGIKPGGKVVR